MVSSFLHLVSILFILEIVLFKLILCGPVSVLLPLSLLQVETTSMSCY